MQDPLGVVDTVQAASLDTVGAFQGTAAPLDKLHADNRRGPVVFHKHHTWAPVGSWPWGSAGLWVHTHTDYSEGKLKCNHG